MDLQRFTWIYNIGLRGFGEILVIQGLRGLAGCGSLWRAVAACGGLWREVVAPIQYHPQSWPGRMVAGWMNAGGGHHHYNLARPTPKRVSGSFLHTVPALPKC